MLLNLSLRTLRNVIGTITVICALALLTQMIPLTSAASGQAFSLTFSPENGVAGSNRVKVMINPDNGNVQSMKIKFGNSGNVFSFNGLKHDNVIINKTMPLDMVVWENNAVNFYTIGTGRLNGTDQIYLMTLVLDPTINAGTVSIDNSGTMIIPEGGDPIPHTATVAYDVTKNENLQPATPVGAKVTKAQWPNPYNANQVALTYEFTPLDTTLPGTLSKFYVFNKKDLLSIQNGYNGLNYATGKTYNDYKTELNTAITANKFLSVKEVSTTESLPLKYTVGINAGSVDGVNPTAKLGSFKTGLLTLVALDTKGNFSMPAQVYKIGDVRASDGGYPDGKVDLSDAKYLYIYSTKPDVCPLPANEVIDPICSK